MNLYGIEPDYMAGKLKPFIKNERYVSYGYRGKRRRLAKNPKNRQFYRVGYPVLRYTERRGAYYEIWEGNGGETFEQAQDFLLFKMRVFAAQVDYYRSYGKVPVQ